MDRNDADGAGAEVGRHDVLNAGAGRRQAASAVGGEFAAWAVQAEPQGVDLGVPFPERRAKPVLSVFLERCIQTFAYLRPGIPASIANLVTQHRTLLHGQRRQVGPTRG